jgi:hypothetical protein
VFLFHPQQAKGKTMKTLSTVSAGLSRINLSRLTLLTCIFAVLLAAGNYYGRYTQSHGVTFTEVRVERAGRCFVYGNYRELGELHFSLIARHGNSEKDIAFVGYRVTATSTGQFVLDFMKPSPGEYDLIVRLHDDQDRVTFVIPEESAKE